MASEDDAASAQGGNEEEGKGKLHDGYLIILGNEGNAWKYSRLIRLQFYCTSNLSRFRFVISEYLELVREAGNSTGYGLGLIHRD